MSEWGNHTGASKKTKKLKKESFSLRIFLQAPQKCRAQLKKLRTNNRNRLTRFNLTLAFILSDFSESTLQTRTKWWCFSNQQATMWHTMLRWLSLTPHTTTFVKDNTPCQHTFTQCGLQSYPTNTILEIFIWSTILKGILHPKI